MADLVFEGVWLALGLAGIVVGAKGLRGSADLLPGARHSFVLVIGFGLLAIATAITDALRKRAWRLVGGTAGTLLGLYGVAMILLGHEDVGGLWVALPVGLAAIALWRWSVVRFTRAKEV